MLHLIDRASPPELLTFALLGSSLVQGIAVETSLAVLTVVSLCVSQAFQTSPSDVVTYSQSVKVHVAITVASNTGLYCPRSSQWVTIVTVLTHLTADPYKGRGKM